MQLEDHRRESTNKFGSSSLSEAVNRTVLPQDFPFAINEPQVYTQNGQ